MEAGNLHANESTLQKKFDCDPKIIWSLNRSVIRIAILRYLYKIYPNASYPAEIARCIDAHPMSVIGGIKGDGDRYDSSKSLMALGIISQVEVNGLKFYKITDFGKDIAEIYVKNRGP